MLSAGMKLVLRSIILCGGMLNVCEASTVAVVRDLPDDCIEIGSSAEISLTVAISEPIPSAVIIKEIWPDGWEVTNAVWNGKAFAPSLSNGEYRWLFGVGEAVASGLLTYEVVVRPGAVQVPVSGVALYGANTISTDGDESIQLCMTGDYDEDGLLDGWEIQYDFNPFDPSDAMEDTGKGTKVWQEYVAGTNPRDSNDVFKVTKFYMSNGVPVVEYWPSNVPGRTYTLRGTDSLTNTDWNTPTNAANFFHIRVEME